MISWYLRIVNYPEDDHRGASLQMLFCRVWASCFDKIPGFAAKGLVVVEMEVQGQGNLGGLGFRV